MQLLKQCAVALVLAAALAGCGGGDVTPTAAPAATPTDEACVINTPCPDETPGETPQAETPAPEAGAGGEAAAAAPQSTAAESRPEETAAGDGGATLPPRPQPTPGVLYVDAASELGEISPLVYGSNFGPWVALRLEVLPLAQEAGITVLRVPGGAWGDQNDLQPYQVDQLVGTARNIGAEPFIHVRLPGSTPEQAAALVRYANVEKGYAVRYWAIGNEPSLYQNAGDMEWDTAHFNEQWRLFAEAMAAVDPDILFVGPEIHQYNGGSADPKDKAGRDWMGEFLRANGDMVDIVSFHRYAFPSRISGPPATVAELRANSAEWDAIIPTLRGRIRELAGRDIPIGVTEVSSHYSRVIGGEATPDSLFNAVWWADVLGRMIVHRVEFVTQWLLSSNVDQGGWGLLDRFEARPTYYVYPLYKRFGQTLLEASSGVEHVSIYAAQRDDGALTLMAINLGDEEAAPTLALANWPAGSAATAWRLDAEHRAEEVDPGEVRDGAALVLPPRSVTLIELAGGGAFRRGCCQVTP